MQVIAVSPSRAQVEALAAGSAEAQSKFLEGVGIVTTQVEHLENVLDRESAELLSCALQHQRYKEGRLTDPYFTEEQWKAVVAGRSALLHDAEELVTRILGSSGQVLQNPDKRREWLGRKRKVPLCDCKAHKCDNDEFFTDVLGELVKLQAPLNDNSGTRFANVLLSHILKVANLTRVKFHGTRGGALGPVQYILHLPSGAEYVYRGRPDYMVCQRITREERQLGRQFEETVRAIGEVQSPRGTSTKVKNLAFAQAGIYTLRHLTNTMALRKLATVVLYKDFTAHVALATICREEGETDLVGDVTYKLVQSINPFVLRNQEDLALFASVFIAALKTTLY